jgi:hypothetical protein
MCQHVRSRAHSRHVFTLTVVRKPSDLSISEKVPKRPYHCQWGSVVQELRLHSVIQTGEHLCQHSSIIIMISRSVSMALIVVIAEIHLFPIPYATRYDMGTMHTAQSAGRYT